MSPGNEWHIAEIDSGVRSHANFAWNECARARLNLEARGVDIEENAAQPVLGRNLLPTCDGPVEGGRGIWRAGADMR